MACSRSCTAQHELALWGQPIAPSPQLVLPVRLLPDRLALMHKTCLGGLAAKEWLQQRPSLTCDDETEVYRRRRVSFTRQPSLPCGVNWARWHAVKGPLAASIGFGMAMPKRRIDDPALISRGRGLGPKWWSAAQVRLQPETSTPCTFRGGERQHQHKQDEHLLA